METESSLLLNYALNYGGNQKLKIFPCWWPVFHNNDLKQVTCACGKSNCRPIGKHPILPDWPKIASNDSQTIAQMWRKWPQANIGMLTGKENNFSVLDEDPKSGGDLSLRDLQAAHGPLPSTTTALTGSGGHHYFFDYVPGVKNNNTGIIGDGLDFKTDGGLIIAPPSLHFTGNRYQWIDATISPAPAPEWLIKILREQFPSSGTRRSKISLEEWEGYARGVEPQDRHNALIKVGGLLFTKIDSLHLAAALLHGFNQICCNPPKDKSEINKMIGYLMNTKQKKLEDK